MNPTKDFIVSNDEIVHWDHGFGPQPTDAELMAVDLTQPTADETSLQAAIQILKTDVPESWKTSTEQQRRIAWAVRRVLIDFKRELSEGGA